MAIQSIIIRSSVKFVTICFLRGYTRVAVPSRTTNSRREDLTALEVSLQQSS